MNVRQTEEKHHALRNTEYRVYGYQLVRVCAGVYISGCRCTRGTRTQRCEVANGMSGHQRVQAGAATASRRRLIIGNPRQ